MDVRRTNVTEPQPAVTAPSPLPTPQRNDHSGGAPGVEGAASPTSGAPPLFRAANEGAALQALQSLIMLHPGLDQPARLEDIRKLRAATDALVAGAYDEPDGSVEFAGPDTLQGHDYIHPIKTVEMCILLARATGMPRDEALALASAAALMNIGYAALRRSLLDEPRGLEEHQWRHQVERHPEYGVRILSGAGLSEAIIDGVAQHHERWDGGGTLGLKGAEISAFARIIAIADTYVTLRSRLAYRNALSHKDAVALIERDADGAFDPDLVRAFPDAATLMPASDQSASGPANLAGLRPDDDDARAGSRPMPLHDQAEPVDVVRELAPPPEDTAPRGAADRTRTSTSIPARASTIAATTMVGDSSPAAAPASDRSGSSPPAASP